MHICYAAKTYLVDFDTFWPKSAGFWPKLPYPPSISGISTTSLSGLMGVNHDSL